MKKKRFLQFIIFYVYVRIIVIIITDNSIKMAATTTAANMMRRYLLPKAIFYYGPMAAGKTSRLIRKVQDIQNVIPDIDVMAYRPDVDTRAPDGQILSRDGNFIENVKQCSDFKLIEPVENSILVLDEAHFCKFDEISELFNKVIETNNCSFVLAGLDRDFRGEPFGPILDMIEQAKENMIEHEVYALNANCYICGEPAAYSKRLVSNDDIVLVGGDDIYQPVCKKHFYL